MTDQVNARERAADPSCTESFARRLAVAAYQADSAMDGAWFAHNHVETSGCEAEFISLCRPKAILRLLREHELFRQALLSHPARGVVDGLPELPEAQLLTAIGRDAYTADQMRDYALRALQAAQPTVPSVPERPNAEWYRRKIMEGADDAPGVIGAGFVYVCSNPSALHQHFLDPKGHCPQCIREGLGNWSCVAATPTHDQPEGSDND